MSSYRDDEGNIHFSLDDPAVKEAFNQMLRLNKYSFAIVQTYTGKDREWMIHFNAWLEQHGIIGPLNGNNPRELNYKTYEEIVEQIKKHDVTNMQKQKKSKKHIRILSNDIVKRINNRVVPDDTKTLRDKVFGDMLKKLTKELATSDGIQKYKSIEKEPIVLSDDMLGNHAIYEEITVAIAISPYGAMGDSNSIKIVNGNQQVYYTHFNEIDNDLLLEKFPVLDESKNKDGWAWINMGAGNSLYVRSEFREPIQKYIQNTYGKLSSVLVYEHWHEALKYCLNNNTDNPYGLNMYMEGVFRPYMADTAVVTHLDMIDKEHWRDRDYPEKLKKVLNIWQKNAYEELKTWRFFYPVKLVRIEFSYKGQDYKIEPEDFNIPEPLAESINMRLAKDLKKIGCTNVRDIGFLD